MSFTRKTYQGQRANTGGDRLPIKTTNDPFYLVHSPLAWDLLKTSNGWEILPQIHSLPRTAGMNGMGMTPGGGVDDFRTLQKLRVEQGFTILEMDYDGGYLIEWKNQFGQPYYTDMWTTPKQIGGKIRWVTDDEGLNDFKRDLVKNGVVPAPDEYVIDKLKESLQRRIDKRVKDALVNPDIKKQKEEFETMLLEVDRAYDKLLNPGKSKKKGA